MSTLNYLITDYYHKYYQLLDFTNAVGKTDYTNKRIRFQNLKEKSQPVSWVVFWFFKRSISS